MILAMVAIFLFLLLAGVPIAFSMGIASIAYILVEGIPLAMATQRFFSNTQSFAFLAVPFFIFAGNLMIHASIAQRIINLANCTVRQLPGGLGCVSVLTSMGMAGVSGSSIADAASTGSVLIPEMKKRGYSASFSAAINASSSVVGIIIPPSTTMIIIAWLADQSVGKLFMAGVLPGVLIGFIYLVTTVLIAIRRGYPKEDKPTFKEFFDSLIKASWALVLPIVIIGSIVFGIATATEAAAISVVYALIVGLLVYRSLPIEAIWISLKETVYATSVVMFMICTSMIFTWILITAGIPDDIYNLVTGLGLQDWMVLLLIIIIMLIAGMVMELVPNLFLLIPILFPIAQQIGVDSVHFSMIMLCALSLGMFTPPVGSTLFISCYIAKVSIESTVKDVIPYFVSGVIALVIIAFIPALSTWLPNLLE